MFYANLHISRERGELETLVLDPRIILNDFLFEKVYEIDSSVGLPYMNGGWPDDFEVSLKGAKKAVIKLGTNLSDFLTLSLRFENRIVATYYYYDLSPHKSDLSSISTRDLFILYCLINKYHLNWGDWFQKYILESAQDSSASASLPYGALIFHILLYSMIDLSNFLIVYVTGTYDTQAFKSIGYVLVDFQWCNKDSAKTRYVKTNSERPPLILLHCCSKK